METFRRQLQTTRITDSQAYVTPNKSFWIFNLIAKAYARVQLLSNLYESYIINYTASKPLTLVLMQNTASQQLL